MNSPTLRPLALHVWQHKHAGIAKVAGCPGLQRKMPSISIYMHACMQDAYHAAHMENTKQNGKSIPPPPPPPPPPCHLPGFKTLVRALLLDKLIKWLCTFQVVDSIATPYTQRTCAKGYTPPFSLEPILVLRMALEE